MNILESPLFTGVGGALLGLAGNSLFGLFQSRTTRQASLQTSIDARIDTLLGGYENRVVSLTGEVTTLTAVVDGLHAKIRELVKKLEEYETRCRSCKTFSAANAAMTLSNEARIQQLEDEPTVGSTG